MGHSRLGSPPKTLKWDRVVAAVLGDSPDAAAVSLADDVGASARQALDAADAGFERALNDEGFQYITYVLTQVVAAARQSDWQDQLHQIGVRVPDDGSILDFASAVQDAIDDRILAHGKATDISEMAQQAVGEALSSLAQDTSTDLFGGGEQRLRAAIKELSTKAGFARLGQRFFGRFIARFLNFYLSRVTAGAVGGKRLSGVDDLHRFNAALVNHCEQSARIVRDFCGGWYSKVQYQGGVDPAKAGQFSAVALKKLRREMAQQRGEL